MIFNTLYLHRLWILVIEGETAWIFKNNHGDGSKVEMVKEIAYFININMADTY